MKFILYVPGMPFDGDTLEKGESLGGSETMGLMLAQEIARHGHSTYVFCNVPDGQMKFINGVNFIPIGERTEKYPFGVGFQKIVENTPHDVLITQRFPGIFQRTFYSKLNYWWTHDLALGRNAGPINDMMWNVNRVLAVSEWHEKQIKSVYQVADGFSGVLPNGIDLKLFEGTPDPERKKRSKTMLYTSRPERGLINLIKEGGIMEQLYEFDPEIRLIVAGYNNTMADMEEFYNYCYTRCSVLPNVDNLGHLSKKDLANTMKSAWIHVYPTIFEETSCITAMEEQAAGTPFLATREGALPETLKDGGVHWASKNGFTDAIKYIAKNEKKWDELHQKALIKAPEYSIENSYKKLIQMVEEDFSHVTKNKRNLFDHLVYNSDIYGAKILAKQENLDSRIIDLCLLDEKEKGTKESHEYYEKHCKEQLDRGETHNLGNIEFFKNAPRMQPIIKRLRLLKEGSTVYDYGCCVGQTTVAMKKLFPHLKFFGSDISDIQIDYGQKYIEKNGIEDVTLYKGIQDPSEIEGEYDMVLCMEVLEHIWDYETFLNSLEKHVKPGGFLVISTPVGPVEMDSDHPAKLGFKYEHLHQFEENDILEIMRDKDNFYLEYTQYKGLRKDEKMGNLCWGWQRNTDKDGVGKINYERKFFEQNPRQFVSCCMIVRGNGGALPRTLESLKGHIHELVVGVDGSQEDVEFIKTIVNKCFNQNYPVDVFQADSPRQIGFDTARNRTIERATKDWILWIDDDEFWTWPEQMTKYLKHSQYDGFAIPQHHYSIDPPGVMKTDFPSRLFRNNGKIKFFGFVHEHPETEVNKGPGLTKILHPKETAIVHNGYDTEDTRRRRFQRNWPLMVEDRKRYSHRYLSQFLWIRDLAHLNRFEYEKNGGQLTGDMYTRAYDAVKEWRKLLDTGIARLVVESLQYVSECANLITNGKGFEFRFIADFNKGGMGDDMKQQPQLIQGYLETQKDVKDLMDFVVSNKLGAFNQTNKYA